MFDFAISQNQRRGTTRLVVAARVLSFLAHAAALVILIENPHLLSPGVGHWLRHLPALISSGPGTAPDKEWRAVTMTPGRMMEPSRATLDRFLHRFGEPNTPPIRLRWGKDEIAALGEPKPAPAVKPVPGKEEPKPQPVVAGTDKPGDPAGAPGGDAPKGGNPADAGRPGGMGQVIPLPPPETAPKPAPKNTETAANATPTSIPPVVPPPPKPAAPPPAQPAQSKVFTNEQQAIRSEGTGFFDTKGFPLGEYADVIIERIKQNWSIPSNLRNSQGRTTVVFFIDKNGRCTDARIVTLSGSTSLDLAALNAVIGSNPFPPLPKGFPGEHVGAKFVFSYNERQ